MTSVALEGLKNNINNYKGVMLCNRPNEQVGISKDRPFVSRVDPKEQMGINPVKKAQTQLTRKKVNPVLLRHRQWLNAFKDKIREKKTGEEMKEHYDKEKFERIRENASIGRAEEIPDVAITDKASPAKTSSQVNQQEQISPQNVPKKQAEKKKKENKADKPKWAYTEKQVHEEEDQDVDDLLAFTNNLDYDKYIDDIEVKHMVAALKNRIDELNHKDKDEDNWKNNLVDAWNQDNGEFRKAAKPNKVNIDYDDRSDARSCASESKSVASERTQKSIVDLKAKLEAKEKKDWDNMSTVSKKNAVTVEERIAKHVADEILRNNTEFRHFHSNVSVRKILEKEARKHLEETKGIRAPEIVSNKEYFSRKDVQDPNNLPYLHRNPAI
jgi:hypothetical protein